MFVRTDLKRSKKGGVDSLFLQRKYVFQKTAAAWHPPWNSGVAPIRFLLLSAPHPVVQQKSVFLSLHTVLSLSLVGGRSYELFFFSFCRSCIIKWKKKNLQNGICLKINFGGKWGELSVFHLERQRFLRTGKMYILVAWWFFKEHTHARTIPPQTFSSFRFFFFPFFSFEAGVFNVLSQSFLLWLQTRTHTSFVSSLRHPVWLNLVGSRDRAVLGRELQTLRAPQVWGLCRDKNQQCKTL